MRCYSDKIRELRATLNWSQTKLAEYLNVSLASVNRWEKGHHDPTIIAQEKLKTLFRENKIDD